MFREITGIEDRDILSAIRKLPAFYFEGGWAEGLGLKLFRLSGQEKTALEITREADGCRIGFREKVHLFRALGMLRENAGRESFCRRESMDIPEIGVMLDVSRNSVPDIGFLKRILERMALMGLNRLILYMEDVYELEGEPWFGYMRGGYTREQLRLLDDYADGFGIRIVASIQVLGHMEKILRFPAYASVKDSPSCLLAGEEKTYALIEKMLDTMSRCFRSRLLIVGMDETHGLGEGQYRRKNGFRPPLDIFLEHLDRVHALAREKGLEIALYSDMLFSYSSPRHVYLEPDGKLDPEICARIPEDVRLIYWDYYSREPALLDGMMKRHQEAGKGVYAGPLLSVSSFCVNYPHTFETARAALAAVRKYHISMAYGCMWHDDGAECCDWLGLLGMQYYAESAYREAYRESPENCQRKTRSQDACSGSFGRAAANQTACFGGLSAFTGDSQTFTESGAARCMGDCCDGRFAWEALSARFAACTGLCAQWFTDVSLLDVVPCSSPENRWPPNPSKYLLWQDPLEGLYDADLCGLGLDEHYAKTAELLQADLEKAGEKGWFLQVPLLLAKVLRLKTALSRQLHVHYKTGNREALREDAAQFEELFDLVKQLRTVHRQQWMNTCSSFGWSRLDLRYGGLIARLETAQHRLGQYLDGNLPVLAELEAPRYEKDRRGAFLGNGIWKVYSESAALSDG